MKVLQNEDKLLDIALNEKLDSKPDTTSYEPIPSEQIMIGSEIEIDHDDIEMSSSFVQIENNDESTLSAFDFSLNSPTIEYFHQNDVSKLVRHEFLSNNVSALDVTIESIENEQPMEVEAAASHKIDEHRQRSRCNECGVYVFNLSQHKRCVHDFSGAKQCNECHSVYPNRLKLLMHKYYKHVPPRYKCEFCNKQVR